MRVFRRLHREAPIRFALVLWIFANILSDLVAVLVQDSPPFLMFVLYLPLVGTGVAFTLLLNKLRTIWPSTSALYWPLILCTLLFFTTSQALIDLFYTRWCALNIYAPWQNFAAEISMQRFLTYELVYLWLFSFALTLLWVGSVSDIARYNALRASALEAAALRAEASALRLQLNPHFMFNTLNSIAGTIMSGGKGQAEDMIFKLASFLRATLTSDPAAEVPLGEEIATIEAYLDIERVRFGDRLQVEIDLGEDTEEALVPHFILQPLAENAIKHGVTSMKGEVQISILSHKEDDMLILEVVNSARSPARSKTMAAGSRPTPSNGIGLSNIRQRLSIAYDGEASLQTILIPGGFKAVITMPFKLAAADASEVISFAAAGSKALPPLVGDSDTQPALAG